MAEHGDEVGVDWANGLVLHENDSAWHPWDEAVYGPKPDDNRLLGGRERDRCRGRSSEEDGRDENSKVHRDGRADAIGDRRAHPDPDVEGSDRA